MDAPGLSALSIPWELHSWSSEVANPISHLIQFRSLLRQSSQFSNYNFRDYARRKTRDSFREHKDETEERRIQELIQDGLQNLRLLKVSGRLCGVGMAVRCFLGGPVVARLRHVLRLTLERFLPFKPQYPYVRCQVREANEFYRDKPLSASSIRWISWWWRARRQ